MMLIIGLTSCSSANKWSAVDTWIFQIRDTPMGETHGKMRMVVGEKKVYTVFLIPNDGDKELEVGI